jgi:hypothetical protein
VNVATILRQSLHSRNAAPQKMDAKWLQSSVMCQERKFPLRHDTTVDGELDAMQPWMINAGGDLAE